MRFSYLGSTLFLALGSFLASSANASVVLVNASDVIYAAGTQSAEAAAVGGNLPVGISLSGVTSLSFSSVIGSLSCGSSAGCVTLNGGTGNDPDGLLAATSTSSNTGFGSISGITGNGAGYLVGVFVAAGGPSGAAPAALNYTTTSSTSATSYSPLLDQTFFIGDGLTGNGTGAQQIFYVPTGATELYLGISDATSYNGGPGSYGDNSGTFTATYSETMGTAPTPTPEPASLLLFGTGLAGLLFTRRLRRA